MRRNRFRELLDAGEPSLGTHLMSSLPAVFEIVGHCGFDYVEFEAEYSPLTLYDLENKGRAVDLFDHKSSVVKIDQQTRT
ncbi:MAG: 2,4-dihydroxyhept-2-ene-1,7-dioic acid aldolase, partial [bacterium]|nr:2,4-dihydroxyhept-2-ene-1,7-dioic acid aldolase [bacterium]